MQTNAIVLGAGIVGTSAALHLTKRGLSVALVDRRAPGEETSYGNAGVIEGNTLFPATFPRSLSALARIALKRATEANYHLGFLPSVAPWILAFRSASKPDRLIETAHAMRPLFGRAVAEHESLLEEAGATRYLRHEGWLKVYRRAESFAALAPELALADDFGIPYRAIDRDGVRGLEPHLQPVFRQAVHWPSVASLTNPSAVTKAYATRLATLGGVLLTGDARSLHRSAGGWRVDTAEGPVDSEVVVIALGPFAPDVLNGLEIRLPLGVKRGYHHHFRSTGNTGLSRPILDVDVGYCMAPMEQGIRITTGAEFAARDALPTPVQFDRIMPRVRELLPVTEPLEQKPWMGSRPCFPDSRPVIGRAPAQNGLWLAYGHGHSGLTLGPVTGRLVAEMITGSTPFCDPAPYRAERFGR